MLNRKGYCNIRPKPIYRQKTLIKKVKPVKKKPKKTQNIFFQYLTIQGLYGSLKLI